ncbi:MAG: amidohydrolase [Flavobacteriales bacterium]|nr:amidohydrolase [Flavobacteriales bacterium]
MSITLVQCSLDWEDPLRNCDAMTERLDAVPSGSDLIVLPEMFSTGFTMGSRTLAEPMDGPTVDRMRQWAGAHDAAVFGSIIVQEGDKRYNRGLFVRPDGAVVHYDKRHLFRFAQEHEHYAAGDRRVVVDWRGWRILLQICFDLRFPVFSRNRGDYDLALYVANWPEARRAPWSTLLQARAIENQCYVAGVNRVGEDGNGIAYSGDSVVVDPKGEVLASLGPSAEGLVNCSLDRVSLEEFREKFPVAKDADSFELEF